MFLRKEEWERRTWQIVEKSCNSVVFLLFCVVSTLMLKVKTGIYVYNAGPPIAIPIIGRAGASPPSRTAASYIFVRQYTA